MVKISKESQLIEEISGLIDNSNISTQELEILSNAKIFPYQRMLFLFIQDFLKNLLTVVNGGCGFFLRDKI